MSSSAAVWVTIGLTTALAFAVRAVFIVLPGLRERLPRAAREMLELVPPAALASLVVPAFVRTTGFGVAWPEMLAVTPAVAAGFVWKNSAVTIGVGIAAICIVRYGFGFR